MLSSQGKSLHGAGTKVKKLKHNRNEKTHQAPQFGPVQWQDGLAQAKPGKARQSLISFRG